MIDKIYAFFDWVVSFFSDAITALLDTLWLIAQYAFQQVVEALVEFLRWIPVPGFISSAGEYLQSIPPEASWILSVFAFNEGIAMVMGACVLRFIVRRIPLIG